MIKAQEAGAVGVIVADRVRLAVIQLILYEGLHILSGPGKWRIVHIYGGRYHTARGFHPCCVYSREKWVSHLKSQISPKILFFFQAHDQKNSCPAEHGQCLGEHPSEHQQNCSSSTQPASMVGLVKERWRINPLKETTDYLNVSPAPGVLRNFYEISPKWMLAICLCLSLECPVWCSWSMQVSASAMRWNLYTCVKTPTKQKLCKSPILISCAFVHSDDNLVLVLSLIMSLHDLYVGGAVQMICQK